VSLRPHKGPRERLPEKRNSDDLIETAIGIGTALLGSGVLFAVLYAVSVYLQH
jgi:hypothetical protein